jgi:hypothetical protein
MDFQASHDLEDFIAVIEGRETLLHKIAESPGDLQVYLAEAARSLLAESRFLDVLPGFVLDSDRVPMIREAAYENCCRRSAQSWLKCRSLRDLLGITQKLACQVKPGAMPVLHY